MPESPSASRPKPGLAARIAALAHVPAFLLAALIMAGEGARLVHAPGPEAALLAVLVLGGLTAAPLYAWLAWRGRGRWVLVLSLFSGPFALAAAALLGAALLTGLFDLPPPFVLFSPR